MAPPVRMTGVRWLVAAMLLVAACGLIRRAERPATGPLDINTASLAEIEQLPGVTPSMARRIFEGRPYGSLDELVDRGLLSERELDRVRSKIKIGKAAQAPPAERRP